MSLSYLVPSKISSKNFKGKKYYKLEFYVKLNRGTIIWPEILWKHLNAADNLETCLNGIGNITKPWRGQQFLVSDRDTHSWSGSK